jgi:hypothetical protein
MVLCERGHDSRSFGGIVGNIGSVLDVHELDPLVGCVHGEFEDDAEAGAVKLVLE